jgi:hypothetical protein
MRTCKENEIPLRMSDVEIPDMSVEKNRNGTLICGRLKAITEKTGNAPAYVISDNASIMNKGIRESSFVHLRDAGHTLWPCFRNVSTGKRPIFYP